MQTQPTNASSDQTQTTISTNQADILGQEEINEADDKSENLSVDTDEQLEPTNKELEETLDNDNEIPEAGIENTDDEDEDKSDSDEIPDEKDVSESPDETEEENVSDDVDDPKEENKVIEENETNDAQDAETEVSEENETDDAQDAETEVTESTENEGRDDNETSDLEVNETSEVSEVEEDDEYVAPENVDEEIAEQEITEEEISQEAITEDSNETDTDNDMEQQNLDEESVKTTEVEQSIETEINSDNQVVAENLEITDAVNATTLPPSSDSAINDEASLPSNEEEEIKDVEAPKIQPAVHSSSMLSDFARDQMSSPEPNDPAAVELPSDYKLSPESPVNVVDIPLPSDEPAVEPAASEKAPQSPIADILAVESPSKISSDKLQMVIPGFENLTDKDKETVLDYVIAQMVCTLY